MHTVRPSVRQSVVICLIRVKGADEPGRNEHRATIRKEIRPVCGSEVFPHS